MKKFCRRTVSAVLAILFAALCVLPVLALDVPSPTSQFYVSDGANVLSDGTVKEIVSKNDILNEACGAQVVIMTVNGLGGENIESFSNRVFNAWNIGDAKKNNGILLLLSLSDQDYWVTQGKGLEEYISSGTLGVLLDDYLEPDFAAGQYDAGVLKFFTAVYLKLAMVYDIDTPQESADGSTASPSASSSGLDKVKSLIGKVVKTVIIIGIILFLIILVGVLVMSLSSRGRRTTYRTGSRPTVYRTTVMPRPTNPGMPRTGPRPGGYYPPRTGSPASRPLVPHTTVTRPSSSVSRPSAPRTGGGGASRGGGAGRGRR